MGRMLVPFSKNNKTYYSPDIVFYGRLTFLIYGNVVGVWRTVKAECLRETYGQALKHIHVNN